MSLVVHRIRYVMYIENMCDVMSTVVIILSHVYRKHVQCHVDRCDHIKSCI